MKRVALIHDWLVNDSGAEKVLKSIYELYPAPIYTLFHDPKVFTESIFAKAKIYSSILQRFPKIFEKYKYYSFLFPRAIEQFSLCNYDVLLSSSHCVAKGVTAEPDQLHICYCHSPMRYIWDLEEIYLKEYGWIKKRILRGLFRRWRSWDVRSANRVDYFIANSHFVAARIIKAYRKEAKVIYPPVDTDFFSLYEKKEEFYLTASRLVSYKGIEKIVEAFNKMPEKKLVVIGDGPKKEAIKKLANKNIEILGHVSKEKLKSYLQRAKGFVFNAIEDFGILPVEAQATGTPVIALSKGGATETVIEGKTGFFFQESTERDIQEAIDCFERRQFDPLEIRENALRFSKERFLKEYSSFVSKKIEEHFR
jgi:glycosyltransferase involved in cell wall biosynthesis